MGCISSKSSSDEQPTNHKSKITEANHTYDEPMELMALKHDDKLTTAVDVDVNSKEHGSSVWSPEERKLTIEQCASFHTADECDELLQKINNKDDDGELHIDSVCKKDGHNEKDVEGNTNGELENIEFKTVASLRQWLDSPHGGGVVAVNDYPTSKSAFGFYDNGNNIAQGPGENLVLVETSKQQEESIIELVVVFDEYMKQLQIEEENIRKQIHNTELAY